MYAVIRTGGKQYKVAPGDVIEVERLKGSAETVEFTPLVVVGDDGKASTPSGSQNIRVHGKVLGESRGKKTDVVKFRNKTGYRRHAGHRQTYTIVEISGIKPSP